jgi:hypothetical protein
MRPIQDDYFNLQSVQQLGLLGYLRDTWDYHGGNMIQFLIHFFVISPTTHSFFYLNFGIFFILTEILTFLAIRKIIDWLFPNRDRRLRYWIPLLSIAGFEGIFVPGFLGTFGFSLASLAHLWPIMAFIYAFIGLKYFRGSWVFALLLGLIAGNSNLGESAFACGSLILAFMFMKRNPAMFSTTGITSGVNFYTLTSGVFIGTFGIIAAPGFWNRASDQVGLPGSLFEFIRRFVKSFASFTADALTHPMGWIFFLLGVLMIQTQKMEFAENFRIRAKVVFLGLTLIWIALILGSTFAYPAWHQSMGMYILFFPACFISGIFFGESRNIPFFKVFLVLSSFLMLAVFLRIGILGVNRSIQWDSNLSKNVCLLKANPDAQLLGAEIQYPPFGLGVDDVNTWDWMRNKYAGWVSAVDNNIKCD